MRLVIVAVFDIAAESFSRPVFVTSIGEALRGFQDEVNRAAPDNTLANHPQDFQLFELGSFDTSSGLFDTLTLPRRIATGVDLRLKSLTDENGVPVSPSRLSS